MTHGRSRVRGASLSRQGDSLRGPRSFYRIHRAELARAPANIGAPAGSGLATGGSVWEPSDLVV